MRILADGKRVPEHADIIESLRSRIDVDRGPGAGMPTQRRLTNAELDVMAKVVLADARSASTHWRWRFMCWRYAVFDAFMSRVGKLLDRLAGRR